MVNENELGAGHDFISMWAIHERRRVKTAYEKADAPQIVNTDILRNSGKMKKMGHPIFLYSFFSWI